MRQLSEKVLKVAAVCSAILFFSLCAAAQQSLGTLRGNVKDELGGVIIGATVTAADGAGVEKTATTDEQGNYSFAGLPPGRYTVRINQAGFAAYENLGVEVQAGRTAPLDIVLTVTIEQEEVTVTAEAPVGTEAESQAGAVVLRGADLDALPDDPEDLSEALQALAGPGSGSSEDGAQIYVDGFTGGRLPPKESIREIRINRNPFSAEYDRLGYGRVEIFTKPGTDRYRGQASFNFNDESLNARSPFATTRAPYQLRRYGGNFSGPLSAKRASFFLDFERSETDDNEVVRAVVLDPGLNPVAFNQTALTPNRRTTFSPRLDYQINPTNTLVARYTFEQGTRLNQGVVDFNLPTRAYDVATTQHTVQLTETAVLNQKVINETRFQYENDRQRQTGGNNLPVIRVLESFTGGGAQSALSSNDQNRFEIQNYTSWTVGGHALKAGGRVRADRITDVSRQNFAGTFTFGGGTAPQLDAAGNVVTDANGSPVLVQITSLERYRRTLFFQGQTCGNAAGFCTPAQIRARGGEPTQFSITGGDPEASVTYWDVSPFVQDDWRVRPNLTLSAGLRYERQNHIRGDLDFAPRVAFAWSPAGDPRKQHTVIRGGFGIFYQRVSENLSLQTARFNGTSQQQFVVTDLASPFLNLSTFGQTTVDGAFAPTVAGVPTPEQLAAFQVRQTVRQFAPDIRAPYTMQTAVSLERQLPYRVTLSVSYIGARTLHVLRSRNVNAPLVDASNRPLRDASNNLIRPQPALGNVFQFESSGVFNQHQLVVNVNNRFSRKFTLFGNYSLSFAKSDTDYSSNFPVNQYDLTGEYGESACASCVRHRLFIGGSVNALPWGLRLNPTLVANSGRPFNITVGRDLNGDTLFTERPAFATDLSRESVRRTAFGDFDLDPQPGQVIIPRNYGRGPGFFSVGMRLSKTVGFGEVAANQAGGRGGGGRGGGGRGGGGRGGGGRGGFGGGGGGESFGGDGTEHRYNLTMSVNVQNLFNHPSLGTPVGNLGSPFFGQSVAGGGRFGFGGGGGGQNAGARRVDLQLRFSF